VPWKLDSLVISWPPAVELKRASGEDALLDSLFVLLEQKRLLRYGYGIDAGITELDDLADRVDELRARLIPCLEQLDKLSRTAPVGAWLRRLQDACHELLTTTYRAMDSVRSGGPKPKPSDIEPAVNELREAFPLTAIRVDQTYRLPAARRLANLISANLGSPPGAAT
jgi:hypothetical protein